MPEVSLGQVVRWLEDLYEIGGGEGANRVGFTDAESRAHERVAIWMSGCGLQTTRDTAGNLYGRRPCAEPQAPEIWIGSHLDTVPNGGRYDGALGVVGALAAVAGLEEDVPAAATVVAFRDEEGARFGRGFFGSRAVTGRLVQEDLEQRDANGERLADVLDELGFRLQVDCSWLVERPGAYLELHIEQGPVLADRDSPIGIVTAFVGLIELQIEFVGYAAHAGTTPMNARRDAGLAAAAFQLAAAATAEHMGDAVVTTGSVVLEPAASNVVPARARLTVDARAANNDRLLSLEQGLRAAARTAAEQFRCDMTIAKTLQVDALPTHPMVVEALRTVAPAAPVLPSGAGHDAQVLAAAGVPTGMLFVRSLNGGASHTPVEATHPDDIDLSIQVVRGAIMHLASELLATRAG